MRLLQILLLIFIINPFGFHKQDGSISIAPTVPEKTGSALTRKDAIDALNFHNKSREEVNVPLLEWSPELAAYAQEWAEYLAEENGCEIAHRATLGMADENYGENIFWGSGKAYTALAASEAWYSEIKDYTYGPIRRESYFPTGHYTQIVWRGTKEVGIGIAECSNGATIVVANYNPVGNYIGQTPY